ncbi:MAG TPA: hypothetical protein VJ818_02980 [Actinomycetota bacterium]|nr:hypothetical protein [Actinomycetota bacterium]
MNAGRTASAIGKGLVAGFAGTAAMTLSSTIEARMRGRKGSDAPAQAASKVLGVSPVGEEEKKRFGNIVHWLYGTSWGAVRGLLGETDMSWTKATVTHMGTLWSAEAVMLPALKVAPPVTQWGSEEIAFDVWHHFVYAFTTGLVYQWLERSERKGMPVPASLRTKVSSGAIKAIAGARVGMRAAREAAAVAARAAQEKAALARQAAVAATEAARAAA